MSIHRVSAIIVSILFAVLASVVLLYISIASGIGPWIAPVIVLLAAALGRIFGFLTGNASQRLVLIQAMGAHVGLLAVAVGFTFPAYFFIDRSAFMAAVVQQSWVFCSSIAVFLVLWSLVGTFLGRLYADHFLRDSSLTIPVADVVKTTIEASSEPRELYHLVGGVGLGSGLSFAKDCIEKMLGAGPFLVQGLGDLSVLVRSLAPSIWAVGFIAGPAMAVAFFIGVVAKEFILGPLHGVLGMVHPAHQLTLEQYLVAVSSGLVLTELAVGLVQLGIRFVKAIRQDGSPAGLGQQWEHFWNKVLILSGDVHYELLALGTCAGIAFFWWTGVRSVWLLGYLAVAIAISVYQMTLLAGQIGLVQFGRFATFVMLPALVFFKVTPLQAVIISAVVCVVGAAAANLLFQFRLADTFSMPRSTMYRVQLLSSLLGAVVVAVLFWLLCSHLTLGSKEFFAFRGYSRALLIQSFNFDLLSVAIGLVFGLVLRWFGASPAMVLGGLLMPKELVIAFVLGATVRYFTPEPKKYMAAASGVFAAEAVWIFVSILKKALGAG